MKGLINQVRGVYRSILACLALIVILAVPVFMLGLEPGYAANPSQDQPAQENVDRAFEEFSLEAGIQEEVYQQRLQEGQDPEKMPKPYKRVPSLADSSKEVPETSGLETTISRLREVVQDVTK